MFLLLLAVITIFIGIISSTQLAHSDLQTCALLEPVPLNTCWFNPRAEASLIPGSG